MRALQRRQVMRHRPSGVGLVFLAWLLVADSAFAATLVVSKFNDTNDGACDADCSLREAVIHANVAPGADTILLASGTYTLSIPGVDEDASATGDLDLTDEVTIKGTGRDATIIDGGAIDRVIHIPMKDDAFLIMDLTLTNGDASLSTFANGGGLLYQRNSSPSGLTLIRVSVTGNNGLGAPGLYLVGPTLIDTCLINSNTGEPLGGGGAMVVLLDTVHVVNSTLANNEAGIGGALINVGGTVVIERSLISGNSADAIGAIENAQGGTVVLLNSTLSANEATLDVGGIFNRTGTTLAIEYSTITGNSGQIGGIENFGTVSDLANTIIAHNPGGNCSGDLGVSGGYNLSSDASCGFTGPGDLQSTDPMLRPLQDNGGPTQTHALLAGSPAIDAANPASTETRDQRNYVRPADGDGNGSYINDMGAFEFGASPLLFADGFESGDLSAWSSSVP